MERYLKIRQEFHTARHTVSLAISWVHQVGKLADSTNTSAVQAALNAITDSPIAHYVDEKLATRCVCMNKPDALTAARLLGTTWIHSSLMALPADIVSMERILAEHWDDLVKAPSQRHMHM